MTETEKAIRALAQPVQPVQPDQLFIVPVAARKWTALRDKGYKMQQLSFARDGEKGTIDAWGKVLWEPEQNQFKPELTEEQIWKCNQTIKYENGEVVDAVHICVAHQNVVDFARSIEREIGFAKAELWIKRINDAVLAEREECAKLIESRKTGADELIDAVRDMEIRAIRARGTT